GMRSGLQEQRVDHDGDRDKGAETETDGIPRRPTQRPQHAGHAVAIEWRTFFSIRARHRLMHRALSRAAAISERPFPPRRCAIAAALASPTRLSNGRNALGSSPTFPRAEKF